MLTANRACAKCGAELFPDAPREFCSACLLETGLFPNESVAGGDDPGRPAPTSTDFGDYELLPKLGRGGQGLISG
jgi:hypothetical protein